MKDNEQDMNKKANEKTSEPEKKEKINKPAAESKAKKANNTASSKNGEKKAAAPAQNKTKKAPVAETKGKDEKASVKTEKAKVQKPEVKKEKAAVSPAEAKTEKPSDVKKADAEKTTEETAAASKSDVKQDKVSSAEKYREKRKERETQQIEKSKNKKAPKISDKAFATVAIIVTVVLLAGFLLNFFGVPRKTITAVKLGNDYNITIAEYEFYYRNIYNYYHQQSAQYEAYGTGYGMMYTGYDSTKTPQNQKYTLGDLDDKYGKNPTWADYFESMALQMAQIYNALYYEAKDAGYKLTKAEQKEINASIKSIEESASDNDYSLDAYLRVYYGKGMSEKLYREIYEKQMLSSDYETDKMEKYEDSVKEDDILKEYNDNKDDYDITSVRYFSIASESPDLDEDATEAETKEANEKMAAAAKSKAEKMLASVTNSDSFVSLAYQYATDSNKENYENDAATLLSNKTKSDIESATTSKVATWVFDDSRKAGDKEMFEVENDNGSATYYIAYVVTAPHQDTTLQPNTVRHILVKTTDSNGDAYSDAIIAQRKTRAEEILALWKNGDKTSDSFAKLAEEYSEDSGSSSDGGLIKDVSRSSNYVSEFIDWSVADGRKAGDTGIIQTSYGFHIMYCVSTSKTPEWQSTIKTNLSNDKYSSYQEKLLASKKYKLTYNEKLLENVVDRTETLAAQAIANS